MEPVRGDFFNPLMCDVGLECSDLCLGMLVYVDIVLEQKLNCWYITKCYDLFDQFIELPVVVAQMS